MKGRWLSVAAGLAVCLLTACAAAQAPPVGTIAPEDATVSTGPGGVVEVSGGRMVLSGSTTVTAKSGRNAAVSLTRGGSVLVCRTSGIHLAESGTGKDTSLLLALDRGAMEIRRKAGAGDVVMTPDLRFVTAAAGALDLRMRVTLNGDTCVENRGRKAPVLNITDSFGEASYELKPGQHVMFEHGSLLAVDDRETTPCGCPPDDPAGVPLAEALLRGGQSKVTPEQAAAAHPFPAAASDGLEAPDPGAPAADGERKVQVASTLRFDPSAAGDTDAALPVAAPAPESEPKRGPFAAIGHFFKRIFVR